MTGIGHRFKLAREECKGDWREQKPGGFCRQCFWVLNVGGRVSGLRSGGRRLGRVCSEGHEGCVASQGNVAKGMRRQTIEWRDSRN